jgi:hypothetical protein
VSALQTLSELPVEQQKDALASATKRLLPHSETEPQNLLVSSQLVERMLQEIRDKLKIQSENNSPEAYAKILDYLSQTLSSLLTETDPAKIKARLGERGELSPPDYRIVYPRDFSNFEKGLAIRPAYIREALTDPTAVQHLSSEKPDIPTSVFPSLSFYSKVHLDRRGQRFSLIVQSIREGDVQRVYSAWRVYHDDIEMPDVYSPLEVFRGFVSKYGDDVVVRGESLGHLLLYKILPGVEADDIEGLKEPTEDTLRTLQIKCESDPAKNVSYFTFAYYINLERYCADLLRRGVEVRPDQLRLGTFNKFRR